MSEISTTMNHLNKWVTIAIVNLSVVALLGLVMRLKMIFSIPFIDFKYILHAHSHFAFGGWVTLALLALFSYKLLPHSQNRKPIYNWLLGGIFFNACGMLLSFPFQGYGIFSILFSTLFIFTTYAYAVVFIRDLRNTQVNPTVKLLATASVVYMVLSSAGAFTLAYLLATKSTNVFLYKDAIYTYLHLQYNGFFTLAIFSLMIHHLELYGKGSRTFAHLMNIAVLPSMFMSYLWHYPDMAIRIVAIAGSALVITATIWFFIMLARNWERFKHLKRATRNIATLAMISFALKMIFQSLTIIPSLGPLVFANRPVIIGFLHLVLLGFVTLYLLAHFIQCGLFPDRRHAILSVALFIVGVLINEVVLLTQGLGVMLMISSKMANWLLLGAAGLLFLGGLLMAISKIRSNGALKMHFSPRSMKSLSQS